MRLLVLLRVRVRLLLASLLVAVALPAAAAAPADVLLLRQTVDRQDVWPYLDMLAETGAPWTLDAAMARDDAFRPPATPRSNLGPRRDAVWLRLPLRLAEGDDGHWLLAIDYPALNRVDVYLVAEGPVRHVQQALRLGSALSGDQRPLPTRSHAGLLDLMPGVAYTLYLRVQSESSMIVPITLSKPERFHAHEAGVQFVQGVLAGVALALLVYSLAHWGSLRNAMFGLYAAMVLGSALFFLSYFGLVQQHLFDVHTGLAAKLAPLSVLLALTAAGRFIALALGTRHQYPRLYRALHMVSNLAGIAMAGSLAGVLDYRATQLAPTLLGPLLLGLSVPAAWVRARRGDRVGVYMLVGWTGYLGGAMVMAALLRGWLPANAWTQHLFQAGWMLEMLAWLRVLGLHVGTVRRAAEQAQVEKRALHSLAYTDALTGLPNRRGLALALDAALARAGEGHLLALYLLDLDGFKAVNDRLGHGAGDALLVQVGHRLREPLRHGDVVARLGGDEFVIVVDGLHAEAEALAIGRKLLAAFDRPFTVAQQPCSVGATVGFALAPHDARTADGLLKRADAAMYAGKQAGRHTLRRGNASYGLA